MSPEIEDVQQAVTVMTLPELEGRRHELDRQIRRLQTEVLVGAHPGDGWQQLERDMVQQEIVHRLARLRG